jgi:hypothetical protein
MLAILVADGASNFLAATESGNANRAAQETLDILVQIPILPGLFLRRPTVNGECAVNRQAIPVGPVGNQPSIFVPDFADAVLDTLLVEGLLCGFPVLVIVPATAMKLVVSISADKSRRPRFIPSFRQTVLAAVRVTRNRPNLSVIVKLNPLSVTPPVAAATKFDDNAAPNVFNETMGHWRSLGIAITFEAFEKAMMSDALYECFQLGARHEVILTACTLRKQSSPLGIQAVLAASHGTFFGAS